MRVPLSAAFPTGVRKYIAGDAAIRLLLLRLPAHFCKVSKQQLQITAVEPALKYTSVQGCLGPGFLGHVHLLVLQDSPTPDVLRGFDLRIRVTTPKLARMEDVTPSSLMSDGAQINVQSMKRNRS